VKKKLAPVSLFQMEMADRFAGFITSGQQLLNECNFQYGRRWHIMNFNLLLSSAGIDMIYFPENMKAMN